MKKIFNFRKTISFTLLLLMVFSLLPSLAFANEDKTETTSEKNIKTETKGPNIEIIENNSEEIKNLKEKYRLLVDENGRLRIELRRLNGKLHNDKEAKSIPVLMYHHILKQKDIDKHGWGDNSSVLSLEAFNEQMEYLYENDFYVASLEELEMFIDGKLSLPEKTVVITFDDGYLSNAIYAYPVLQKYNFRATIFMIGYRVDGPQISFDPSDTQALSVKETTKYTDVFDYQSHTYNMHDFNGSKVPILMSASEEEVKQDLLKNKSLLNAKYLAYPYGQYNDRVIRMAQETGHRLGFTINKGFVQEGSHKFRLSRNGISQSVTMKQFIELINCRSVINNNNINVDDL